MQRIAAVRSAAAMALKSEKFQVGSRQLCRITLSRSSCITPALMILIGGTETPSS